MSACNDVGGVRCIRTQTMNLASSDCIYVSEIGSSSAVGTASKKLVRCVNQGVYEKRAATVPPQYRQVKCTFCIGDKLLQVRFTDTPNRIDVR